jgi:hypothetical protein
MPTFIILVISALAATAFSAQLGKCNLSQEDIQKTVMECASHEPYLMFQVIEHIRDPKLMATSTFICQNQNSVVNLLVCLEDKFVGCLGSVGDSMMPYLPNKERWQNAVKFMCDHDTDFIGTNCMDKNQLQEFMQCYMGKLYIAMQPLANKDFKTSICSVIHSEEQCFKTYHGTCSQKDVSLMLQLLDVLFPFCPVLTIDVKEQLLSDARGSILVQGQPLKFQPLGNVPYKIFRQK